MQYHHTTLPEVEDNVDVLLGRLEGVHPAGPRSWMARCPAHDDRDPSLSVSVKEGRILLYCLAGCAPEAVLEAVGLTWRDLRAPDPAPWASRPALTPGPLHGLRGRGITLLIQHPAPRHLMAILLQPPHFLSTPAHPYPPGD